MSGYINTVGSGLTMNDIHHHLREINTTDSELSGVKTKKMRSPNHFAHELMMKHHLDIEKSHTKGGSMDEAGVEGGNFWHSFVKGFEMPFKAIGSVAPLIAKVL